MTDSMGPGKLVRHMQNLLYTYDEYLICIGLGPSISSVICKNLSYSGLSYPSSPVYIKQCLHWYKGVWPTVGLLVHMIASWEGWFLGWAAMGYLVSAEFPITGWSGRYIHVWCCRGLSMVFLPLKDHLELFRKRSEFLRGSGYLSCCVMT